MRLWNPAAHHSQVIVAEAAPTYEGQRMACELAALGIQTTAITDSVIYAMMARVNKVGLVLCERVLSQATGYVGVHKMIAKESPFSSQRTAGSGDGPCPAC